MTVDGLDTRVHQNSTYFHERIARLEFGGLAHGESEGDRIAGAVTDGARVVMLDSHGVIAIGTDCADAWFTLYFLERAARVQVLAASTGSTLIRMPDDVARRTREQFDADITTAAPALFAAEKRRIGWHVR